MAMAITWLRSKRLNQQINGVALLSTPFIFHFIPVHWLNGEHTICLIKNIFGRDCYGCGITRAVLSVLHFDFYGAFNYNKLIVIVFPLLVYIWAKALIKSWNNLVRSDA
ncbi:DUF2752 domain-containing protein [Viscerimonas tarda]